jgi:hypothetical protein
MSSIVIWQKGLPKIEKISFDYLDCDGFEIPIISVKSRPCFVA